MLCTAGLFLVNLVDRSRWPPAHLSESLKDVQSSKNTTKTCLSGSFRIIVLKGLTWKSTRMWLMKMVIDAHVLVHCALCGRVWAYVSWSEVKIYCKRTSAVGEAARYTAVLMNYRLSWLHVCFLYVTGSFVSSVDIRCIDGDKLSAYITEGLHHVCMYFPPTRCKQRQRGKFLNSH